MAWDKFKTAQVFLQKANAIHPEEESRSTDHDRALAMQDLYYDCYMSSFGRENLISRLQDVLKGNIEIPDDDEVDADVYREAYIHEAGKVLASVEGGEIS